MSPIICPACLKVIGYGTVQTAGFYAANHGPHCNASESQHKAAVERMRSGKSSVDVELVRQQFDRIVSGLKL